VLDIGLEQALGYRADRLPRTVRAVQVHAHTGIGLEGRDRVLELGDPLGVGERIDRR
jgi:hypothetical protein